MKQKITHEQYEELSISGKKNLAEWYLTHRDLQILSERNTGKKLLLNIGDMIEFLDENLMVVYHQFLGTGENWKVMYNIGKIENESDFHTKTREENNKELCDALWGAVKKIIEL